MKKLSLISITSLLAVASTLFANSAMAIPIDYTFSGSNIPQSGESAGTLNGVFTLDDGDFGGTAAGSDVSFTISHLGPDQTWNIGLPGFSLFQFDVTTNGIGDVTSFIFDADATPPNNFLFIEFDVTAPSNRDPGTPNKAAYCGNACGDILFLDNWDVSKAGAAVPEPSIIALFALGLVGLGFARRRRQS